MASFVLSSCEFWMISCGFGCCCKNCTANKASHYPKPIRWEMSVNDVLSGVAKWWEHVACCTTPTASTATCVSREVAHRVKTEQLHLKVETLLISSGYILFCCRSPQPLGVPGADSKVWRSRLYSSLPDHVPDLGSSNATARDGPGSIRRPLTHKVVSQPLSGKII